MKLKMMMVTLGLAMAVPYLAGADTVTYALGYNWKEPGILIGSDVDTQGRKQWSDDQAPHGGADYVIGGSQWLNITAGFVQDAVFAGDSLTLGAGADHYWNGSAGGAQNLTINNFTLSDGAVLTLVMYYPWTPHLTMELKGSSWTLAGNSLLDLVHGEQDEQFVLEAPFSGTGTLKIRGRESGSMNWPTRIIADNSAFKGVIRLDDQNEGFLNVLEFSDARALGGAPDAFLYNALTIGNRCGLKAVESMALDTPNRGVAIGNGYVEVDSGKTLSIAEPIRLVGSEGFAKKGTGTLLLGSEVSFGVDGTGTADGVISRLTVAGGAFGVISSAATRNLDLVFMDGAALAVKGDVTDERLLSDGLVARSITVQGASLPVVLDLSGVAVAPESRISLPICTVSVAEAAAFADKLAISVAGADVDSIKLVKSAAADGKVRLSVKATVAACRLVVPSQDGLPVAVAVPANAFANGCGVRLVNGGAPYAVKDSALHVATLPADAPDVTADDFTYEGFAPVGWATVVAIDNDGKTGEERHVTITFKNEVITYANVGVWEPRGNLLNKDTTGENDSWSDGLSAHGEADYLVDGYNHLNVANFINDQSARSPDIVFPGRSLTVKTGWQTSYWEVLGYNVHLEDFTLDYGLHQMVLVSDWDSHAVYRMMGRRWVVGWSDGALLDLVCGNQDQQIVMAATLEGRDRLQFSTRAENSYWTRYNPILASTNRYFQGAIIVNIDGTPPADMRWALEIAHPLSLGGRLNAFKADALQLNPACGLKVTETMTLNTFNRGMAINNGFLEVAEGKVLTMDEPIRLDGANGFGKYGAGTLVLGGDFAFGTGAGRTLTVFEGAIKPASDKVGKLSVSFASGTSLAVDLTAEDMDVAAKGLCQPNGLTVADAQLPVQIDVPATVLLKEPVEVAICTVPDAQASKLVGRMVVRCRGGVKRHHVADVAVKSAGGGQSTIVATVDGPRGMTVTIR